MLGEVIKQALFEKGGADEVEPVLAAIAHDRGHPARFRSRPVRSAYASAPMRPRFCGMRLAMSRSSNAAASGAMDRTLVKAVTSMIPRARAPRALLLPQRSSTGVRRKVVILLRDAVPANQRGRSKP
jgi:hypothetical protein